MGGVKLVGTWLAESGGCMVVDDATVEFVFDLDRKDENEGAIFRILEITLRNKELDFDFFVLVVVTGEEVSDGAVCSC